MDSTPKMHWTGKSGVAYTYWIHAIGTSFVSTAGNYMYAKETRPGYWLPVYIGQTDDLGRRLANHDQESQAKRHGATHIHAHTNLGEHARLAEEADLCAHWKPACNTQLV